MQESTSPSSPHLIIKQLSEGLKPSTSTTSQCNSETIGTTNKTLDQAADSFETRIKKQCQEFLSSQLNQYNKVDWTDFSTAGRSHVSLQMAQQIVFKQAIEIFKKDNPNSSKDPQFKTKPDWFGYGVEVEMKLIEECPTNVGKPFILTHYHECYFNGDGILDFIKKHVV